MRHVDFEKKLGKYFITSYQDDDVIVGVANYNGRIVGMYGDGHVRAFLEDPESYQTPADIAEDIAKLDPATCKPGYKKGIVVLTGKEPFVKLINIH